MKQYRQGDVFIVAAKSIPKATKKQKGKTIVLAYGEVTGHAHTIEDEAVESFVDSAGTLYLNVEEETVVRHQEHSEIKLPKGIYVIKHQREYTPEAIRNVQD